MAQTLYGLIDDSGKRILATINSINGDVTPLGPTEGLGAVEGLTFGKNNGHLYAVRPKDKLLRINRNTGEVLQEVGPIEGRNIQGLASDPSVRPMGLLYGVDIDAGELVSIDPHTAMITPVGPLQMNSTRVEGLAFDPASRRMIGAAKRLIVEIDIDTGRGTALGSLGSDINGLAFDADGVLYGVHANNQTLVIIGLDGVNESVVGSTGFAVALGFSP